MEDAKKEYQFAVKMQGYDEIVVEALDRYEASRKAARAWGVAWRETARDMDVRQIGSRPVRKSV